MLIKSTEINLNTSKQFEIIDITSKINQEIANFNFCNGIINIFSKHSTSAIAVNENEKGLLKDFEFALSNLIDDDYSYNHDLIDNNASSHLKSLILSSSETVPVKNSKIDLGTWQSLFFIELDGPRRNRKIVLTLIGK